MADMTYTTLGHSGIRIPRLCLGGMSFGKPSADFHQWTIGRTRRARDRPRARAWA